jgi:hypothetical protein
MWVQAEEMLVALLAASAPGCKLRARRRAWVESGGIGGEGGVLYQIVHHVYNNMHGSRWYSRASQAAGGLVSARARFRVMLPIL